MVDPTRKLVALVDLVFVGIAGRKNNLRKFAVIFLKFLGVVFAQSHQAVTET